MNGGGQVRGHSILIHRDICRGDGPKNISIQIKAILRQYIKRVNKYNENNWVARG